MCNKDHIDSDIEKRIEKYNYPDTLYHYTSMQVLYNIIKTRQLWMGNSSYMNDKEEITHFIGQLESALIKNLPDAKTKECQDFFCHVRDKISYPYILCFSRQDDDAAQWERYADDAKGVCIAFNLRKLMRLFYEPFLVWGKIYYDYNIEKHDHYDILYKYFATGEILGFDKEIGQIENMIACGYIHKHRSFRSESEIRLSTLWNHIPRGEKVESECINGVIKSFIKVDLRKRCEENDIAFLDLFDEIVIGPRSKMSQEGLSRFFSECGVNIPVEKIKKSECPLR